MDWFRTDVGIGTDPKIIAVGLDAAWLFICGLAYVGKHETDGFIPTEALKILTPLAHRPTRNAQALVRAGLWAKDPAGYQIPKWSKHNPSHEEMDAKRERSERDRDRERERKAEWRTRKVSRDLSHPLSHGTNPGTVPPFVPPLDTERHETEDLATDSTAALNLNPAAELPLPDNLPEGVIRVLDDDQTYLLAKIARANPQFRDLTPAHLARLQSHPGSRVLRESLRALYGSVPAHVDSPAAYLDGIVERVASDFDEFEAKKGSVFGAVLVSERAENGPVLDEGGTRTAEFSGPNTEAPETATHQLSTGPSPDELVDLTSAGREQ